MKISVTSSSGQNFDLSSTVAIGILVLFAGAMAGAWVSDHDLFKQLAQTVGAVMLILAGFLWGSSTSSRAKDQTISTLSKNQGDQS